jgi:hypothetical protein
VDSYNGAVRAINSSDTYHAYPYTYTYDDAADAPYGSSNHNKDYAAVLAAAGTSNPSLTIGNSTTVKGFAAAASSSIVASLTSFGTSASLTNPDGSITSAHLTSINIDLTRVSRSADVPQFDSLPGPQITSGTPRYLSNAFASSDFPYGTSLSLSYPMNLGTPGATTPSRYYYSGGVTLAAGQIINVNGPTILYINGNFRTNTGTVYINGPGSLELHLNGQLRVEAGSGGFINRTLDPKKLVIITDATTTSLQYFATAVNPFHGVIYAPYTTAPLGLDIRTGAVIYGALSAKNITFSTEANLHYDTSLRYAVIGGVDQPFTVSDWRELPLTEQATMP